MSTVLLCNHEVRQCKPCTTDSKWSPRQKFQYIDEYLRDFENKLADWPTVAQLCLQVREEELWKQAAYTSWADWIHQAAPMACRTVFYYLRLFEKLNGEFTTDELREMPVETAKTMTQLSKSARKNPEIRKAAKQKKREFVRVVKQVAPEQHIEESLIRSIQLTESQDEVVEKTFTAIRAQNPDTEYSDGAILEMLCALYWAVPE